MRAPNIVAPVFKQKQFIGLKNVRIKIMQQISQTKTENRPLGSNYNLKVLSVQLSVISALVTFVIVTTEVFLRTLQRTQTGWFRLQQSCFPLGRQFALLKSHQQSKSTLKLSLVQSFISFTSINILNLPSRLLYNCLLLSLPRKRFVIVCILL